VLGRTAEQITVGSSRKATATPKPICWNITSCPGAKPPPPPTTLISAAPVTIRAVDATPCATASRVDPDRSSRSVDEAHQERPVVRQNVRPR
jgi:hypothetical protein